MSDTLDENRTSKRRRTLIGGRLVFNGGHSVLECTVRDISETGALLQLENALASPPRFSLVLSDGRRFECEMRWRRINRVGVQFTAA